MNKYEEKISKCKEYTAASSDNSIMLLKGGSYKIKSYYLETNNLSEIRGASMNLAYVEDIVIQNMIADSYDKSCIIYNGGGNIFCILPSAADESFALRLEEEAQKYLVSASTAYVVMEATWDDIENNYKDTMRRLEEKLADRKKLKIAVDLEAKSTFFEGKSIPWENESFEINAKPYEGESTCDSCKVRQAYYLQGKRTICASCLHKYVIGTAAKSKYDDEYKLYTGQAPEKINDISSIDREHIAVVYGDGNNMGQIIQNFTNITKMMEFSDKVKATANKAVFTAMKQTGIKRFEVVGLGGDDVFVIVSGKIAMSFAVNLMNNYNEEFKRAEEELKTNNNPYKSTMSVGVCIAKNNTPIRIMLEAAEDKLAEAKELSKRDNLKGHDTGTIAYAILDDPTQNSENMKNKFGAKMTLQPFSYKAACNVLSEVNASVRDRKTRIRNLYDAFMNADTAEEAMLFYKYQNAKSKKDRIRLPQIDGWIAKDGLYTDEEGNLAFIWKDLIELFGFADKEVY